MSSIEPNRVPVIITVRGEQYYEGTDPDVTELMTEGYLSEEENGLSVSYEETDLTGMEGTTTTFTVRGQQAIHTRTGTDNSQKVFEEGKQHTSLYGTLFGELSVDIQTSRLRHNLTARGGILEIRYTIAVEHTVTGKNMFKIRVRTKN